MENAKPKKLKLGRKENVVGLLFIAPPVLWLFAFTLIPVLLSAYIGLTEWTGFTTIDKARWVGLANYRDIFTGLYAEEFRLTLLNTAVLLLSVPIGLVLALLLAVALNKKIPGAQAFRVVYYIPAVASVVAVTILFTQLFNNRGAVNDLLGFFGIPPREWLHKPGLSKAVVIALLVWRGLGYNTLLYLAGLQGIGAEYYEAARLDGASSLKMFLKITVPLIAPVTFFLVVTGVMGGLQIFTEPSILFPYNYGKGPEKGAETVMVFLYYTYSKVDKLGVASAVAWVLAALIFAVTAVQFYFNKRRGGV
jgi:multiple sugar transport system permease protein